MVIEQHGKSKRRAKCRFGRVGRAAFRGITVTSGMKTASRPMRSGRALRFGNAGGKKSNAPSIVTYGLKRDCDQGPQSESAMNCRTPG